ncbi:hypothetical protein [Devriesea agamarum]|uniref:hypothetical protein n=1 Tax=Devriesea agamarum TaxID=472569 RepID=UPI00071C95D0|nr:hypothetical protein [Devriesea agamarum]
MNAVHGSSPSMSPELGRVIFTDLKATFSRPAVWVCIAVWFIQIGIFAYLIQFIGYQSLKSAGDPQSLVYAKIMRSQITVSGSGNQVLVSVPLFGLPVAVVVGAVLAAADHKARSLGLIVGRLRRRSTLTLARCISILIVTGVMALSTVFLALAAASIVGVVLGDSDSFDPSRFFAAAGATWLALFAYASFGAALSYIFKGAMTGMLTAMGWMLGVEMLIIGTLAKFVGFFAYIQHGLLSTSVGSLSSALADGNFPAENTPGVNAVNSGVMALLVICIWIIVSIAISIVVQNRRDIT